MRDLHGGTRWMPELGLYDDRNRFMSPDLGRFLQPDPIGFKGDASNLYRYCGNDWANRTDPMGLEGGVTPLEGDRVRWEAKIANEKPDSRKDFAHMPLDQYHAAFERGAIATARINNDIARHQGATVTGQLQGRHFSPSALKNATKGESNDRETPTGLELRPKETDDREFYKIHHVQVKHNDSDLHVNGVAEEHVQKISGNLHFEPSGPILFGRGDVADRVGPKSQPSANVTGDLVTKQWYTLYTERPGGGLRYYDMPQRFRQHTHIERGQVTAADVTPW